MNYSGNMPDWHQYNPPQAGRTSIPGAIAQNANTSQHIYIPGISPPALDGINLSTERHRTSKHQNDAPYVSGRNYPVGTMAGTTGHMTTPLAGCVSHYGSTSSRNPMMDGHLASSSAMDPRMVPPVVPSINDDVAAQRTAQMSFTAPSSHPNVTNGMTINTAGGHNSVSISSQNSPIDSMSPGRQAPIAYGTCKAPCCNHDPNNLHYQHWDKFPHYPNVPTSYRENIRQSVYPIDNRRFLTDMNLRKDCLDNKDIMEGGTFPVDHRTGSSNSSSSSSSTSSSGRNFAEYNKYTRKDSVVTRNYPPPPPPPPPPLPSSSSSSSSSSNSLMHQNYPMQNYNFPNDYQKCPYSVKDFTRRGNNSAMNGTMNAKNSGIIKYHQEQSVIVQQKYHQQHSKQMQYPNGTSAAIPTTVLPSSVASSANVITSPLQNSYFNAAQLPRDLSRDYSRDYHQSPQDQAMASNRMAQGSSGSHVHGSFQKYHVYHHKLAMQRYSVENHLRAFSRIPGYQSHPKYQECMIRYRELLRLQQTVDYQSMIQESPKVPSPATNGPVGPINLQFDQNGVLINSSYIHTGTSYPAGIHPSGVNHSSLANSCSEISGESSLTGNNRRVAGTSGNFETPSQYVDHRRDLDPTTISTLQDENPERYCIPTKKNDRSGQYEAERLLGRSENLDSMSIDVEDIERTITPDDSTTSMTTAAYNNSKDFADKPELDVRQFLANWDESEDEDAGTSSKIANAEGDSTINEQQKPSNTSVEENLQCNNKEKNSLVTNSENPSSSRAKPLQDNNENEAVTINNSPRESLDETEIITKNIGELECIRAEEMDDIPTIHIVENLECGSEMEKIHTVFGSLANISTISIESGEIVSGVDNESGETIVLFEHEEARDCTNTNDEVVEGVIASIIESSTLPESVTNEEPIEENEESEITEKQDSSDHSEEISTTMMTTTEMTTEMPMETTGTTETLSVTPSTSAMTTTIISSSSSISSYNSSVTNSVGSSTSSSSKSNTNNTTNLRKQNSFTSDESHNPDDISLPDLQTSECTPISTTLNTPIQSDNEESSEHVTDLTISTNPIEIIQNSPIISFTHSPIKIEPYEQLNATSRIIDRSDVRREHDSLDFDFDEEVASNENRKYNEDCPASPESVVQELENQARHSNAMRIEKNAREKEENGKTAANTENYEVENVETREEDFYRTADPLVGMAQITRSVTNEPTNYRNLTEESTNRCCGERANDENGRMELDTDVPPTSLEREDQDDFNRSEDLEKLCEMSLDGSCMIPLIPDDDCGEPRMAVSPMEGNCLTKILNDTMPITDLDMLESSDNENIDKTDDDIWDEVRNMRNHFAGNSASMSIEPNKGKKETMKKLRKTVKHAKVITRLAKSLSSSPTDFEHHFHNRKDYHTSQNEIACRTTNFNETELGAEAASSPLAMEEIVQTDSKDCKDRNLGSLKCSTTTMKEKLEESVPEEEKRKMRISCDERTSRDEKQSLESVTEDISDESHNSINTKSYFTKHRDSNVEIQVANLNVKIHNDNELMRSDSTCSKNNQESVEGIEAIEIKINLSRGDRRSNKSLNEKLFDEETKEEPKKSVNSLLACSSRNICFRRRRRSMPDANNDGYDHYVTKKMSKCRYNVASSSRRKIRRSMDDELLSMNEELSKKEQAPNEYINDQKETTKTLNIAWPCKVDPETINDSPPPSPLAKAKEDESMIKKRAPSTKNKNDSHTEKYTKDSTCRLPSPSYNSSVDNSSTLDFDNFDVAPNRHSSESDNEAEIVDCAERKSHLDERDRHRNPTNYGSTTSCFDDLTSPNAFEINLNTVPIYTTKDGRITYSPNRNYTYRALIIEARQREQRYLGIGKFHYSRHLTRNNYRETTLRKSLCKRRGDEKKHRTNVVDGHPVRSKRSSTPTRRRSDERKHENRCTRVSSELLEKNCTKQQTETRSVSIASSFLKSEKSLQNNFTITRQSEDTRNRNVDLSLRNFTSDKGNDNDHKAVNDSSKSPKHFGIVNRETDTCLVSKIFQGQELEISSRKVTNTVACPERQSMRDERDEYKQNARCFQDSSHLMNKTPMASPMTTLNTMEKRPIGCWDLDCQTALSDSGLESSTTYVEASKESRKIQRWRNSSFIESRLDSTKSMYSMEVRSDYHNSNRSSFPKEVKDQANDSIVENETLRYLDDGTNISKVPLTELAIPIDSKPIKIDEPQKNIIVKLADETKLVKSVINIENVTTTKTIRDLENREMSEIVKSLDLAITSRTPEETRKRKKQKEEIEKLQVLQNLGRVSKIFEGSFRRVSSDGVNSKETCRSFFQTLTIAKSSKGQSLKIIQDDLINDEDAKEPIELENIDEQTTTMMSEELPEHSLTRENFHQSSKDFLFDSCTSFSSCMKMRVPEPVSELPTESEASHLEDTSTRFASESMDFKDIGENENIASFSARPMMIDNDTNGRDSLFGSVAENAMNASNESDRSKESKPGNALMLSFSGRIQSDKRFFESPSKSPPDLTSEDSIPKLVLRKSEIPSKAPTLLVDEKLELPILENEITNKRLEHEIISHPKIPKMIIRNVKSRPGTPTAIEENEPEMMKNVILRDQPQIFKVATKLKKKEDTRGETGESKIPKMKIKLEDKQMPRMIMENARGSKTEESSRLKMKKVRKLSSRTNSPIRADKFPLVGKLSRQSSENETRQDFTENTEKSNVSGSYKFTLMEKSTSKYQHHHHFHHHQSNREKVGEDTKQDKIPKFTIKKQDVQTSSNSTYSSSQSINKKRRSRSPRELVSKKQRRVTTKLGGNSTSNNNNKKEETRSREGRRNSLDSNEGNTDSHQSLSEKIPKVIIKRTSPSAEFKCELSKDDREAITKDSKWQPEVKLQRSWVLDCMAKEPGNSQVALKVLESAMENIDWETTNTMARKSRKWKRSSSDSVIRNVSPINEGKIRRKSDCEEPSRLFSNCKKRRKSLNEMVHFSDTRHKFKSLPVSNVNEVSRLSSSLKMSNFLFSASKSDNPVHKLGKHDDEKKEIKEESEKKNNDPGAKSSKKTDDRFDDVANCVIKLDSSDESQTTIEILPASPDNSQPELDMSNQSFQVEQECIGNGSMGKLYSEDAIPTQFELELEIVDNSTIDSLDVPLPLPGNESSLDDYSIMNVNIHKVQSLDSQRCSEKEEENNHEESKRIFGEKDQSSSFVVEANMNNICCSDSLVKEVLAAKETLKRCLTKSKSTIRAKAKPRPKTAAEKKQGSGYDFVDMPDFSKRWKCDNEENVVKSSRMGKQSRCSRDRKNIVIVATEGGESRMEKVNRTGENSKSSWMSEGRKESTTVRASKHAVPSSTNSAPAKSGKSTMKKDSQGENWRRISTSTETRNEKISTVQRSSKSTESTIERIGCLNHDSREDCTSRTSYKIPKISRSRERKYKSGDAMVDDEKRKSPSPVKMPILEPQTNMKFEPVGSDRDTSRSPPVITKQEEPEIDDQAPKKLEEKVNSEKLDSVTKQRETEAVTFADIVSQLAYHEKATIRHRRYCTLCERWFPTAARHRRHLSGYQHRHTELTQRRTVHALFMLFTGKPCPRLLPASIVRSDCLPGEPTPLQIAVQDVAISLEDGARVKPNKDVSEKDE